MAARKQIDGANAAAAGLLDNGVVDATVAGPILRQGRARLLRVDLPMQLTAATSVGRYFLARCGAHSAAERLDQWHIYLRRALFVCTATPGPDNDTTHCDLLIEPPDDAAYRWLASLSRGAQVNLIGPLGNGFSQERHTRNLLLAATVERFPVLLPLMERMLDSNGRVTVVLFTDGAPEEETTLVNRLPLAVEVRFARTLDDWTNQLDETITWSDQLCAALPRNHPNLTAAHLAEIVRRRRLRLEQGYAQLVVDTDLVCGFGGCLACVVSTAGGGLTRACVHGPVFDLTRLAA